MPPSIVTPNCNNISGVKKTICELNRQIPSWKQEYDSTSLADQQEIDSHLKILFSNLETYFVELRANSIKAAINTLPDKVDKLISKVESLTCQVDLSGLVTQGDLGIEREKVNLNDLANKISGIKTNIDKIPSIKSETDKIRDLAKKDDIPDLNNLLQKNDLSNLVKTTDLSGLNQKVNDIKNETDNIKNLATKADIPNTSKLAEKDDLKDFAKKSDLSGLGGAPVDLSGLAKTSDLTGLGKKIDNVKTATDKINGLATKVDDIKTKIDKIEGIKTETDKINDLAKTTDLSSLAKKDDLKDFATKADIPDLIHLVQKSDLNNLNQQITNFAQQDQAFDQKITQEIRTISQGINIIPQVAEIELVKGNGIAGGHEAEIKLANNNSKIGAFSSVGYYFFDNRIYIYDHLNHQISIDLPQQYHFLKVVKTEDDKYKLAFCNSNGQEYYNIPNDYKLINPIDIKSITNINFAKYYAKNGSNPSFFAKANSSSYSNSERYSVEVYEINNRGKKVGSLIDEFGYFDSQNRFHYFNNHIHGEDHHYNSPSFTIDRGENNCNLHEMRTGTQQPQAVDLTHDDIACSLVEYVANYVNNEYFYH